MATGLFVMNVFLRKKFKDEGHYVIFYTQSHTSCYIQQRVSLFLTRRRTKDHLKSLKVLITTEGHLFYVELKYFFHIHRDADEDRVVGPIVTRMSGDNGPDWT